MSKPDRHPTGTIWDAVTEIAVDGTMRGKLSVRSDGETGGLSFETPDGRRWSCHVYEIEDKNGPTITYEEIVVGGPWPPPSSTPSPP